MAKRTPKAKTPGKPDGTNASVTVSFDGACEPFNPGGIATWGFVVVERGRVVKSECGLACKPFSPQSTNNYAEYTALIRGLEYCLEKGYRSIVVKGDSQLVIRQMTGEYSVRSENIIPLFKQANSLAHRFDSIDFVWVRRESNEMADRLSKQAYQLYMESHADMVVMPFGKFKGKPIAWVAENAKGYLRWLLQQDIKEELRQCIQSYL
jgi:ribonuclease HI